MSKTNGTIKAALSSDENTNLTFSYLEEEEGVTIMKQNGDYRKGYTSTAAGIGSIPNTSSVLDAFLMSCTYGVGENMPLQIKVPLKRPNQVLHDLITHNID